MFRDQYKKGIDSREERQDIRRKKLLAIQKLRRQQQVDAHRAIPFAGLESPKCKFNRNHKKHRLQDVLGSNVQLQLSEWLREKPDDLNDWLLVPCPRGQRCLVVSCGGRTEMYSKAGRIRFHFSSALPNGGASKSENEKGRGQRTVLDCIYDSISDSFYILDALSYGRQDLIDCEAQFRFFWLRSRLEEHPELLERNEFNEKPFQLLKMYDFENSRQVAEAFQTFPLWFENVPELDGFLFYHREASYSFGTTPLVCWLFPFMVMDMLGMMVSSEYITPAEYSDPLTYMANFDEKLKTKRNNKKQPCCEHQSMEEDCSQTICGAKDEMDSLQTLLEAERQLEMDNE